MNSTTIPAEQAPSGASFTEAPQRFADLRRRARTGIFVEAFGLLAVLSIAFALPSLLTDRLLRLEWVLPFKYNRFLRQRFTRQGGRSLCTSPLWMRVCRM
jgi:hypothetical protein